MAWSASAIFQQAMLNPIARGVAATSGFPTAYTGLTADSVFVALFNNTTAPDKTAAVGSTGYNTGTWTTGNEISSGGNWPAAGISVGTTKTWTVDSGSSSLCYQVTAPIAGQTGPANAVTLTGFYGCMVYDNTISGGTVSKQGMCFNYFGGTNTITLGNFTILWATPASAAVTAIFNISV
jgi:hypothetical protein